MTTLNWKLILEKITISRIRSPVVDRQQRRRADQLKPEEGPRVRARPDERGPELSLRLLRISVLGPGLEL